MGLEPVHGVNHMTIQGWTKIPRNSSQLLGTAAANETLGPSATPFDQEQGGSTEPETVTKEPADNPKWRRRSPTQNLESSERDQYCRYRTK